MRMPGEEVVGRASFQTIEFLFEYKVLEDEFLGTMREYKELQGRITKVEDREWRKILMSLELALDRAFERFNTSLCFDLRPYRRGRAVLYELRRGGRIVAIGQVFKRSAVVLTLDRAPAKYLLN